MSDLVKRLRIKAGMIEMGERIAWGSDSALMREAADALDHAAVERKKVSRPQIREVFLRNGAVIPADRDDLPDYVYEAAFELLESQLAESEALLAESRANDRQAMAYLAAVREVVGGDDFPDMVRRCEKLRKDADRYRWLRAIGGRTWTGHATQKKAINENFDAAIDAAMEPPK